MELSIKEEIMCQIEILVGVSVNVQQKCGGHPRLMQKKLDVELVDLYTNN